MPELPEVETTKASLHPLIGQVVTDVQVFEPKLRWLMPNNLNDLIGYQLDTVERRAKYLIVTFTFNKDISQTLQKTKPKAHTAKNQTTRKKLIIHLGMSGSLQQYDSNTQKRKHDHLILSFKRLNNKADDSSNSKHPHGNTKTITQLHYHDPRRFGAILWYEEYGDKLLNHLGVEPLSKKFDGQYLYDLIHRINNNKNFNQVTASSKTTKVPKRSITRAIKSVIMDQQFVVGVGNIYAAESLFLSGIHPATPANALSKKQLATLVGHIKTILKKSIEAGGSSLKDFTVASGQTGYFQQTLYVYGRLGEPCKRCGQVLENIKINGRASVFCPKCQPINS